MTTIDAVYQNGVFRPATVPDLPEGTVVRIVVVAEPPVAAPLNPADSISPPLVRDPIAVFARLKRIADLPEEPGGDPTITGRDHDRTLYGNPGGVRGIPIRNGASPTAPARSSWKRWG